MAGAGTMLSSLLDIFFPPVCPLCESAVREGELCASCDADFSASKITGAVCTICGDPFTSTDGPVHSCALCIKNPRPFVGARSAFVYDGRVLEALHSFKYNGRLTLAAALGRMTARAAAFGETTPAPDRVVPVPLHKKRLAQKGFNHSLLMAKAAAKEIGAGLGYANLVRTRDTPSQVGLKGEMRRKNVAGAFALKDPALFKGKRILLLDDVYTTGATVSECARVLKRAGAEIYVVTLARTLKV